MAFKHYERGQGGIAVRPWTKRLTQKLKEGWQRYRLVVRWP